MGDPSSRGLGAARNPKPSNSTLGPDVVRPYGPYGAGLLTGHPVGLVVVAGVILMTLFEVPGALWFLAGSLLLGGLAGIFLWLRHR